MDLSQPLMPYSNFVAEAKLLSTHTARQVLQTLERQRAFNLHAVPGVRDALEAQAARFNRESIPDFPAYKAVSNSGFAAPKSLFHEEEEALAVAFTEQLVAFYRSRLPG